MFSVRLTFIFLLFLILPVIGQSSGEIYSQLMQQLRQHVAFLASDSLQGRGTGSRGEYLAAEYIKQQLLEAGVQPFGDNLSWFQNIPMHGSRALQGTNLCLLNGNEHLTLNLSSDFLLFHSGVQTFIPTPTEMVFVGYGISAPEFDYNDYISVDVQGKIAVFLEGEPVSEDDHYFKGSAPTIYSYPESKQRTAIAHGAIGSILLHISGNETEENWSHYQGAFSFDDISLAYRVTDNLSLLLKVNDSVATFLFKDSGHNLQEILKKADQHTMRSFPLKTKLKFSGRFKERDFIARNVIGLLPANTYFSKDEYVIVSAHYDHLGIGFPVDGDSIYNGAMDNAAGVAGVLELAKLLNASEIKRNRPIIFLLVTGEESGLLGSTYYTDHPIVPLYKTFANLNVDGLAMFDTFNDVIGVGAQYSTLGELLNQAAEQNHLMVSPIPPQFLQFESFARSDQMAFAWAGVPSILVMDGLSYRHLTSGIGLKKWLDWNKQIYHSPFDDLQQPINWQAAAQHVLFLKDFLKILLNTNQRIEWKNGVPFKNIRLQTIAERR